MFKLPLSATSPRGIRDHNLVIIRHRLAQIELIARLARISELESGFDLIPTIFSHAPYQMSYVADRQQGVLKVGTDNVLYRFHQRIIGTELVFDESIHHAGLDQRKYLTIFRIIEKTFDTAPPNYAFDGIEDFFSKAGATLLLS